MFANKTDEVEHAMFADEKGDQLRRAIITAENFLNKAPLFLTKMHEDFARLEDWIRFQRYEHEKYMTYQKHRLEALLEQATHGIASDLPDDLASRMQTTCSNMDVSHAVTVFMSQVNTLWEASEKRRTLGR